MDFPGSITLHHAPWVNGSRSAGTFGPVSLELPSGPGSFESDLEALLRALSLRAGALGANAIVGLTIDVHLEDAGGYQLRACGTATRLESIH